MTLLRWDKPARVIPVEEWKRLSADDAPPGVYVPNMSPADAASWKAKLVGTRSESPQVEVRKSFRSCQMTIIVGLDGYNYKQYTRDPERWSHLSTRGYNIHVALNGPAQMTFNELGDMYVAVEEARTFLIRWMEENSRA